MTQQRLEISENSNKNYKIENTYQGLINHLISLYNQGNFFQLSVLKLIQKNTHIHLSFGTYLL